MTEPVFDRQILPNGLRVLTADMPQAKSVACFVMLAAGSRYETKETNGIAHFAEHMFFKGTERRPSARDIAGEIDSIGGEFNAFTGKEYTGYYIRCASEQRDTALDVLVDMLRNSRFDAEELEPSLEGDLRLIDSETGQKVEVSLAPSVLEAYRRTARAFVADCAETCRRRGAAYAQTSTKEPFESFLLRILVQQGILR